MQHLKSLWCFRNMPPTVHPGPCYQQLVRDVVWQHHPFNHTVPWMLTWQIKLGWGHSHFVVTKQQGRKKPQVSQCLSASGCCRWGKSGQRYLGKPCPCNEMWAESFLAGLIFPLLIFHRWRMSVCERTANTARTGYTLLAITHLSSLSKEEKTRNLAGSRLLG